MRPGFAQKIAKPERFDVATSRVLFFEQQYFLIFLFEIICRREPGNTGADDDGVERLG